MLTFSKKALAMPYSPIRKLIPLSDETAKRGIKIYRLNMGQPDLDSPKVALDAVKENNLTIISYPNSLGDLQLREGMVGYYKGIGIDVETKDIIVTHGGSEAIQISIEAICDPDDEIIVFEPFYTNYNTFSIQFDAKLVPITTHIEDGFALPPMSEVEKVITPKTKAILICNPANPTGKLYSKEDVLQLCSIAKKHGLFIIADEVYREFCYTDEPHFSFMQVPGMDDNIILIDSVSKRYSMCGARVGFIVSRNKELMPLVLKYAQARLCCSKWGQIASLAALDTPQEYFDKVKKEYLKRRQILVEGLNKIEGIVCPMPLGAFYAAVELPVDDSEKFCRWLLEEFNYEGQTVMFAPMAGFYVTKGLGKNQARFAYVLKEEDLRAALVCLEKALKEYPGRTI
ncbi:MAG: pyridoxal phosphate-dependent aminotransferase [Bacteroidales bacterium]|nr:pyridoxal phosphate-dependent aminotransferase [Bacteroidales bacterium]